jgi:hypothetical protein
MVGQLALVGAIGRAADQDEAAVAIAAIDIAGLVDLQEHAGVAQRRAAGNVGRAVASDAGMGDADDFGRCDHAGAIARRVGGINLLRRLAKLGAATHDAAMILVKLAAIAALIVAAPAAAMPQKATKPAAAKPAAKPAPGKPAAAKAKAKARPRTKLPPPALNIADKDGFGVMQVAAPDAAAFIAAWKIGDGAKNETTRTVADKPLFTLLIFRGCKADADGKCDIVSDFAITRPDGTINEDNKGVVVWDKTAPADPKKPMIGDGALGYGVDSEGPFGDYRVVATVTDKVAGTTVTTEQTLTIAPALAAPEVK